MAKFLFHANYVGEGVKGLLSEGGSRRRVALEQLAGSLGGRVESTHYAFGDTDIYVIADMPDNASAAALALVAEASGSVVVKTTVLLTPEEIDEAVKMTPDYRPPGQ